MLPEVTTLGHNDLPAEDVVKYIGTRDPNLAKCRRQSTHTGDWNIEKRKLPSLVVAENFLDYRHMRIKKVRLDQLLSMTQRVKMEEVIP